ncbi:hypothetical protein Q1695_002852 [Nippostrongylus brasiliensis]|nr:hypothetical protein Q1695_002852 [Nippostrongylus brasiliensis]
MLTDYYASMDSDVHSLSTEIQALKSMLFMLEKEYILKKTTIEAEMGAALYIQKEAVESIRNNGLERNRILKVVHEIQYELSTTKRTSRSGSGI